MLKYLPAALTLTFAGPASAGVPDVVADIAPIQSIAARVMQGVGTPDVLLPPGADPHHYAMRPSEARLLQNADFVLMAGAGLTPWLNDTLDTLAADAQRLEMARIEGVVLIEAAGLSDDDDHTGEHHHEEEGHGEDHHEAGHDDDHSDDPHMWLNPENAIVFALELAESLATADPEHADAYVANASEFSEELLLVISDTEQRMEKIQASHIVTHDAFAYFETRFGKRALGAVSNSHATRPGAAHLKEMQALVSSQNVTCVLAEPGYAEGLLETVFEGHAFTVSVADPLGGSLVPGADLYAGILSELARAFEACAG
ncbi:MAG: zinc ABC transporter substrate-binding protein [Halocynthiibacter sp.]